MIYCINPDCYHQNPDNCRRCQKCKNDLLIQGRYRLIKPLRELHRSPYIEVFEVNDNRNKRTKLSLLKVVKTAFRHLSALLRGSAAQVLYSPPKVLKILRATHNEKYAELFEQEARILTCLRHAGIPKAEPDENFPWRLRNNRELRCLVMEKIEGQTLEQWLLQNQRIYEDNLALDWLKQIVEILDYVHQRKYFHRDIKPSNIMLKPDGSLVLIDFGTAREVTQTVIDGRDVTEVRSFGYTAPEQEQGRAVPQSDFFALGRTFVHLLTGSHPRDFLDSQTGQLNWRDHTPHVSQELADFIDQLMARSVQNRFRDTQFILQRLEEIRGFLPQEDKPTEPTSPPPDPPIDDRILQSQRRVIVVGLIAILLLGLCIWKFVTLPSSSTCLGALDVNEMAFSPDGKYIATASLDNTVRMLKPSSNQIISKDSHEDGVIALKFSPDGKKIATASFDAKVGLWEMSTNGKISPLKIWDHPNYVVALAFSPKGNFLATATVGGSIRVLETNDLKEERKRKQYDTYVRAVSFSSDGKYLAIVGRDNKALVWEWQTNKDRLQLNDVVALAFSPKDARYLATADAKGNVKVLDTNNNFEIVNAVNLETYPTAINFSPEGKHLLLLGWNKKANLWEWETQDKPISLEQNPNEQVMAATFSSKSGKYIATVNTNGTNTNGTIKIWNNSGTFIKQVPQNNNNSLVAVTFNPKDDTKLTLTNANGCLQILKWSNFISGSWVF